MSKTFNKRGTAKQICDPAKQGTVAVSGREGCLCPVWTAALLNAGA